MGRVIILKNLFVKGVATVPHEYLATCKERWTKDERTKFVDGERKQNMQAIERLRQSGLWDAVGHEERNLMQASSTEVTRQMLVDASWSVESIVCLLWALGYISELLPYDQQADPELTNKLPKEPAQVLMKKAVLRDHGLIETQRDLAELWHWRSHTRQLQEWKRSQYHGDTPFLCGTLLRQAAVEAQADGAELT